MPNPPLYRPNTLAWVCITVNATEMDIVPVLVLRNPAWYCGQWLYLVLAERESRRWQMTVPELAMVPAVGPRTVTP